MADEAENVNLPNAAVGNEGAVAARPALLSGLRPPNALVVDADIATNWKLFKQKWNNYSILTNLAAHPREYQVALLLHTMGDEALKVYNGFQLADDATVNDIITAFDGFAIGHVNETYERFILNNRSQLPGESFETFLSNIRQLIKTCSYCDNCMPSILRDRIVVGVHDKNTQASLLKEHALTLDNAINICKAAEHAEAQSKTMQGGTAAATAVCKVKVKGQPGERICKFCGKSHPFKKELCPAWGQTCRSCQGQNHFSGQCPKKKQKGYVKKSHSKPKRKVSTRKSVNYVDTDSDTSDSYEEWINSVNKSDNLIKCQMIIANQE